ncbi:DNA repair protein XRCC2 homolog [Dioscorea cayenensis subsp. rotundata]|uniref:DNA repair protein XRCC2 homolog n=1 Tax=Dioscorea cayennensis subsp. rotundata TaxID=55577 RepID=A0AB40CF46_DIOCR|nr:DNA repair protein XRCC2 homolog [Dioscorea cayenensis subsp. rotundata]
MTSDPRAWISGDESAAAMLSRLQASRPALLVPPLHRVPLRTGNVVEIAGPSHSGKSQVLLEAVMHCILPKEWKGIHFGGLEKIVVYFDLDCRFDVLRLSNALRIRIMDSYGLAWNALLEFKEGSHKDDSKDADICPFDDELFLACMRRFLYIRCYSTLEFLAALKTMHHQMLKEYEALGVKSHILIIDSIGAHHWIDRSCQPSTLGDNRRKGLSLQCLTEAVVHEIRNLLRTHPMLVLATKATIFGVGTSSNDRQRTVGKHLLQDTIGSMTSTKETQQHQYREYMPSIWQSFVTHRICLRASDRTATDIGDKASPIYTSEWVLPQLNHLDKFVIRDDGIFMLP